MSIRALIVDDEPEIRELTAMALCEEGFSCALAPDGDAAQDKYDACPFDLVVTDLRMPRRHGHSLVVELLQRRPRPQLMVLSVVDHPSIIKDLYARGVDDVMFKPVNYSALAARAIGLMRRRKKREPETPDAHEAAESLETPDAVNDPATALEQLANKYGEGDGGAFPDPPPTLQVLLNLLSRRSACEAEERRAEDRQAHVATMIAVPVDGKFRQNGKPLKVLTRDLSDTGVGFVAAHPIVSRHAVLCASSRKTDDALMVKITRCNQLKDCYEIGGIVISKWKLSSGAGFELKSLPNQHSVT